MEVKVKIKRNYKPKSTLAVLINYKRGLQRLVKFIYPDDWDIDQLDFHINLHSEFNVRNVRFSEDISMMRMKDNLEEIKKLGYRVISLTQTYGYILERTVSSCRIALLDTPMREASILPIITSRREAREWVPSRETMSSDITSSPMK